MAATASIVEFYFMEVAEAIRENADLGGIFLHAQRSQALPVREALSPETIRVVYDGARRGHFSRLLSEEEWETMNAPIAGDTPESIDSSSASS